MMNFRLRAVLLIAVAVTLFTACSANKPSAEVLNRNGNQQYTNGDFAAALETYRKAEVLRPDLPALNYNAGNALNHQNDFVRALEEDQRAVHSVDAAIQDRAYYAMGDAYVHTNQLREAVDAYKSALRADPSDVDAKYNLEVIQRQFDQQQADQAQQQAQAQQGQADQPDEQARQPGQASQPGEQAQDAQPGQSGQAAQPGQGQASQPGPGQQASGGQGSSGVSGYTGTPAGQAAALDPNLKRALDQFNQTGSVDDALRALDIVGQQERLRQAGSGAPQQNQGRDW
jgi:Ca-activated chloride channel family protein